MIAGSAPAGDVGNWENRLITSDEEFASDERSDAVLVRTLGRTLDRATLQLAVILAGVCAITGMLAMLVS
jgi:hypothetical protein